jgi:hypothetical protein
MLFIILWKISGALVIPKSNLLKQYRPIGVRNVVRSLDSSARGICQKPQLASNFVNISTTDSSANRSSILRRGWTFRWTLCFSHHKSTHIQMDPLFLGTQSFQHTIVWAPVLQRLPSILNFFLHFLSVC